MAASQAVIWRKRFRLGLSLISGAIFSAFLATGQAQTNYQQLLSFGPTALSGNQPRAKLMEGSDGWLYGTTFSGGISNAGTIFRVGKDGAGFSQIYAFTNSDRPQGGLVEANDGTLCGTTSYGGSNHYGTVFKCNKDGSDFSILRVFPGGTGDGTVPNCTLIKGHDGILYGTTYSGGASNLGTVFALNTDGSGYAVLHHFTGSSGGADGSFPFSGVCQGSDGALYGTTLMGGSKNEGIVFKVSTNGTGYTILRHFNGGTQDGRWGYGGLVQASNGRLFGTTYYGGTANVGTIFTINTNGGNYAVLHRFQLDLEGLQPFTSLTVGDNQVLYGTARYGGISDGGTVFRINPDGTGYAVLHRFAPATEDGYQPLAPLLLGSDGALYGSTYLGGVYATNNVYGTLFRLCSPPTITAQPQDQTITVGQDASFSVSATGTSPLGYQWSFNGTNIPGATASSYTRYGAQPADAGNYAVTITNMAGSVFSSNALLTLQGVLTIIAPPTNLAVCAGSPAVFTVEASGLDVTYQWQGSGDGGITFTNLSSTATNASYTNLITTAADDGYQYQVIVSGAFSPPATSAPPAILTVSAPAIADAGLDQTVCASSPATTLTGSIGGAAISATWSGAGTFIPDAATLDAVYIPTPAEVAAGVATVMLTTDDPAGPCGAASDTMTITIMPAATVNAGPDQTVSADNPATTLAGSIGGAATSAMWSGAGSFAPDATTLDAVYTPTAAEIAAGTATVTLTTDDPAGPCEAVSDSMTITITSTAPTPVTIISLSGTSLNYTGGSGTQFVLLQSADPIAPLANWTREATNTVTPGVFTVPPVGAAASAFYIIQSE